MIVLDAITEIVEGSYHDDDAFSSPPFASGFGREEEDGPSAPPPFGREEPAPAPPPSFRSKLPTSGFRDSAEVTKGFRDPPDNPFRDSAEISQGYRDSAEVPQGYRDSAETPKGFRESRPPHSPKVRRPRRPERPYPTVGGTGSTAGGSVNGDLTNCFPPTCIPPSTAALPLPSSSHHPPLPPQHDEHNRNGRRFLFFLDSRNVSIAQRMISQPRSQ